MKPVTISMPNTGRMCVETLEWLARRGIVEEDWQVEITSLLDVARKNPSEDAVKREIMERWQTGSDGVTLKYDPRSGYRASFLAKEVEIAGIPVLIYGAEAPASNAIMQSEADIAIVGFDSLLASLVAYVKPGLKVQNWRDFGDALRESSTDIRCIGETGIEDYAAWFIIGNSAAKARMYFDKPEFRSIDAREIIARGEVPIAVKGRYEGLVYYFFGQNAKAVSTENIEDAVKNGMCGFDIVRTGRTIQENNLFVIGPPVLETKSVIAVDKGKYALDPRIEAVAYALKSATPIVWEKNLRYALKERWLQ